MNRQEIGIQYLDALADAQHARRILETNDGDNYGPCGDTEKRVKAEFDAAVTHLALATRSLVHLAEKIS